MRTTRIRPMENTFVVIPNREIIGDLLVNHSFHGGVCVTVPVGIAYQGDIAGARATLLPALASVSGVEGLRDPARKALASLQGLAR